MYYSVTAPLQDGALQVYTFTGGSSTALASYATPLPHGSNAFENEYDTGGVVWSNADVSVTHWTPAKLQEAGFVIGGAGVGTHFYMSTVSDAWSK